MNYRLFGFDYNITKLDKTNEHLEASIIKVNSTTGLESLDSGSNIRLAKHFFLDKITPDQWRALKNGDAFLEFWQEAIDHSKPTLNRRLYPLEVFLQGMESHFNKMLTTGGVPSELEHPLIQVTSDNDEKSKFNLITRLTNYDRKRETHTIIGHKVINTKSYFKIRTSTINKEIIHDILEGKTPAFSIRTVGDFSKPNAEGISVAQKICVVGMDYVRNPANAEACVKSGDILNYVNPITSEKLDLRLLEKTGTESFGLLKDFISNNEVLMYSNSLPTNESLCNMIIINKEELTSKDKLEKDFKNIKYSIL